jgi:hypothetical protein
MENELKDYSNDPDDYLDVVERPVRSGNSIYWVLVIILLVFIFYRTPLYKFVEEQVSLVQQSIISQPIQEAPSVTPQRIQSTQVVTPQSIKKATVANPHNDREMTIDELVQMALTYERQGKRQMAHIYFQSFLSQLESRPENASVLIPAAVEFYSRGNELSADELALLKAR